MSRGPQPPRGTQDMLPPFSERFAAVERAGAEVFERAGYRRIITPMFEDADSLSAGVGEESELVTRETYTFPDRSGNMLTLRPEGTAPVMRALISHHLWERGMPVKLWYSAAMFRYERPQKGRYRQHHQLGIEAVGADDPALDAEVIAVGGELIRAVGAGETSLLVNSIGHPGDDCRNAYLPALRGFLAEHGDRLDDDCRRRMGTNPLRVFDCKDPRDRELLADAPLISLCPGCREHYEAVQAYLKELGIGFTLAPRLVRGLDYYTRTTFEFQSPLLEAAQNTVCGGGRYDLLVERMGGPSLPGIGFGAGIERLVHAQEAAGNATALPSLGCYVIPLGDDERRQAVGFVRGLRYQGIRADIAYGERGLKAHMKHADRLNAAFAGIIGPEEASEGNVTLRDMRSGEQTTVSQTYATDWLVLALKERGILVIRPNGQEPF